MGLSRSYFVSIMIFTTFSVLLESEARTLKPQTGSGQQAYQLDERYYYRRKRAIAAGGPLVKGLEATQKILSGAVDIFHTPTTQSYVKIGSYQTALKDFKSIRAEHIRTMEFPNMMEMVGVVGNRQFTLRRNRVTNSANIWIHGPKTMNIEIKYN